MKNNIEAIIWDLDGTLIDSDLYVVLNYVHMYQKYRPGYYPHLREILGFSGPSVVDTMKRQFPDIPLEESVGEFEKYSKENQSKLLTLYPGEMNAIESIFNTGVKMILLTNKKFASAKRCMESTGLIKFIPQNVSLDDVKVGKPNPEGVFKCLNLLKSPKEKTLIIGDSSTDIVAGKKAGIISGLVTWSLKGLPKEERDYEFDSFEDIKEFIVDGKYNR